MNKWNFIEYVKGQDSFRIIALGVTGSGKTVFLRKLLNIFQKYKKFKMFICDTKHEFDDIKDLAIMDLGSETFIRKIQILNLNDTKYEMASDVCEFCCALTWNFVPALCYVEEIPEICSQSENLPTSHRLLYKVLQQGRGQRANLIVASQQISQTNYAFIRQATDKFVFAIQPEEATKLEKSLSLTKGTLKFDLPTAKEVKKGELKDLFSFYHLDTLNRAIQYERIPFTKGRGRKKKALSEKKKVESTSQVK